MPMEERSLDAYENGWKKAIDLGIYNQWTAKMRDALGRLNSELYPPFKETGFEVRSQGPLPLPAAHRCAQSAPSPRSLPRRGRSEAPRLASVARGRSRVVAAVRHGLDATTTVALPPANPVAVSQDGAGGASREGRGA